MGKLLEIHRFPRLMARVYWVFAYISLSNLLLTTVGPFSIAAQNRLLFSGLGSVLAFIYGGYVLKHRNPMAPLFLLAWLLLLLGTIIQVSALSGFMESTPLTRSRDLRGYELFSRSKAITHALEAPTGMVFIRSTPCDR